MQNTDKKEYLKHLCEKLAYVCFTEDKDSQLKRQGFTHEHIETFSVRLYINQYIQEDGDVEIDLKTYITIALRKKASLHIITNIYYHPVFTPAIIDKVLERDDDEPTKIIVHEFGRPNPVTLYDSEFVLEEELGVVNV
jgi:hypothetical protein